VPALDKQGRKPAPRPFSDPAKAREAARRSVEVRRERAAGARGLDARVELEKLVSKGGMVAVQALRELRAMDREEAVARENNVDVMALLTIEQREIVRGWLVAAQKKDNE
jgi:hypothetical protein